MGCCGDGEVARFDVTVENAPIYMEKICFDVVVPEQIFVNMEIEQLKSEISKHIIYRIRSTVPYRDGEELIIPKTWWDHFKSSLIKYRFLKFLKISYNIHKAREYMPYFPYHLKGDKTYFSWIEND